ncbi:unnamed protein product [Symbiodinium necroappetens]|uniref:Uncharacterized protein n=1 Tax=Symbiodinium necroappetens TaxID=1628268 RepID=A0A812PQT3_9DINO|nr:unnamed protein product [Symbiodinium necroappetens]
MEASNLVCVEDGSVELLELTWPPVSPADDEDTLRATCLCYAVMRRPGGFLLCLPSGFLPADLLRAGEEASATDLVGLSLSIAVPPISLTEEGEWVRPTDTTPVPALVVDLSDTAAECLAQADNLLSDAAPFVLERPGIFPLASDVLRQARSWAANGSQPDRSGYQTAASEVPANRLPKANPKPKRPTVAQLASQQEALSKAVAGIAEQLSSLPVLGESPPAQAPTPAPAAARSILAAPVSSHLVQPPVDPRTSLPELLGPPPRLRNALQVAAQDQAEEEPAGFTGFGANAGDLPIPAEASSASLAEAMLLQSKALSALVSQLAQSQDPLAVDLSSAPASGFSTRGTSARQKMQAELLQRDGSFAKRLRQTALRRISPTSAEPAEADLMTRYFERFGGFGSQKLLGLFQYQLAQVSDLLAQGSPNGAADLVAQLIIMVEQVNADGGKHDLGFLFSLQPDPPASVFVNHPSLPTAALRPFSPLADARLVASTLAYVKELETLSSRRLEYGAPPKKPNTPPPLAKVPPPGPTQADPSAEPALTKKQMRAKAWASRRAAEGS